MGKPLSDQHRLRISQSMQNSDKVVDFQICRLQSKMVQLNEKLHRYQMTLNRLIIKQAKLVR